MINQNLFAKRISKIRKEHGFTQIELADKLGVTSQAVSKWECGTTLPEIDLLLELSHLYHVSINSLLEGDNYIERIANREFELDGITYFVSKEESPSNIIWAKNMVKGKWIAQNWSNTQLNPVGRMIAKRALQHDGTILEIGTGPGGGFMPYYLKTDPNTSIIVSDISPTVVSEWKSFLDWELKAPNISYAAFNFCDIPFTDNSIDVISDGGGIGNTEFGTRAGALKEAYRVLKPGGLFITSTGFVSKEMLSTLPERAQRILIEKRADVFDDLFESTVAAGFRQIDSIISHEWETDSDDSTIADLARSLGVNLKFTSYVRFCEKMP